MPSGVSELKGHMCQPERACLAFEDGVIPAPERLPYGGLAGGEADHRTRRRADGLGKESVGISWRLSVRALPVAERGKIGDHDLVSKLGRRPDIVGRRLAIATGEPCHNPCPFLLGSWRLSNIWVRKTES